MYTLQGKYNKANIMLPEGELADEESTKQIYSILNHPAFKGMYIVFMPDLHAGAGCTIGFTATLNDYLIPNIVGVDIGCGVLSLKLIQPTISMGLLDKCIRDNIPSGFAVNNKIKKEGVPVWLFEEIERISDKIGSDKARNLRAMGTLGGGNHFIELGVDENNDYWLTIHSGSRKFGLDIANYHQKRAKKHLENNFVKGIPKGLEFLYKDLEYLKDMQTAQVFAEYNRQVMAFEILKFFGLKYSDRVESVHNYICTVDQIIRKGAVSAYKGQKVVIPFNMQDGLIIGVGKGSSKWNNSAPHGAGRVLSRKKAKETLDLEKAKKEMEDSHIWTTSLNASTLDEVKDAYKNKDMIIEAIEETVEITNFVKPIYNFKA